MKYEIWQVKENRLKDYAFDSFDNLNYFSKKDYVKVYEGEHDVNELKKAECEIAFMLDDLFCMFNVAKPSDFRGHSLSVSDVVVLEDKVFYCNPIGWTKVQFTDENGKPWKLCKTENGQKKVVKSFVSDYEAEIYADYKELGDEFFIEKE